jgi:aryl-alcohol dehydrogenase-like predicted oxidoreductase
MRALDDQVRAGKILYVGISDAPAWVIARASTLAEWHGWTPFTGLQAPYSLLRRDIERELLPMAEALNLAVAAWSPLADGILSGKFTGHRAEQGTRVDPASLTEHQHAVARIVQDVAADLGATPAQVAIAWTRVRSRAIHPIIGARSLEQLHDNLRAADLELPPEVVARLDAAAGIDLGFPATFIAGNEPWVFGAAALGPAADPPG